MISAADKPYNDTASQKGQSTAINDAGLDS